MQWEEKFKTSLFRNRNDQNIFYRNWKCHSNARAVVLLVHGFNSHSQYYERFALQLNTVNYEVYAMDLIGRGHSDGERYYIADYKGILKDIDQLLGIAKADHPALPVFLFGHSAGGLLAAVYTAIHQQKLSGFICVSFAFQIPAPGFILAVTKLLGYMLPHLPVVKLKNSDFTRNPAVTIAMNKDPLIAKEKQPAKTIQQLLLAAGYLKKKMPEIRLPLLILHGSADKVTKPEGSNYFMEHAASPDKSLKLYEGYFHDPINDTGYDTVFSDIINWLNKRS